MSYKKYILQITHDSADRWAWHWLHRCGFFLHTYTFCGPRVHLCVCVSVCRRQQITFQATLIFHLIDGLLSTTAAHEVRWAGVLTCGSYHLERSAWPQKLRGWSCQVPEIAQIELF